MQLKKYFLSLHHKLFMFFFPLSTDRRFDPCCCSDDFVLNFSSHLFVAECGVIVAVVKIRSSLDGARRFIPLTEFSTFGFLCCVVKFGTRQRYHLEYELNIFFVRSSSIRCRKMYVTRLENQCSISSFNVFHVVSGFLSSWSVLY